VVRFPYVTQPPGTSFLCTQATFFYPTPGCVQRSSSSSFWHKLLVRAVCHPFPDEIDLPPLLPPPFLTSEFLGEIYP